MEHEGSFWWLVRRNAQVGYWFEATDDAMGIDIYGDNFNNPTGTDSFSVEYNSMNWI